MARMARPDLKMVYGNDDEEEKREELCTRDRTDPFLLGRQGCQRIESEREKGNLEQRSQTFACLARINQSDTWYVRELRGEFPLAGSTFMVPYRGEAQVYPQPGGPARGALRHHCCHSSLF